MSRLPKLLSKLISEQAENGVRVFRTGGARGFDTLAALAVLDLRERYPDIKLELFLPCKDQTAKWNENDRRAYEYVLDKSDRVSYVSETYYKGCMFVRNRRLVDGASVCIAYYDGGSGGTAYTVNYAAEKGLSIKNTYDILNEKRIFGGFF
jgi:uncharacterized phage-like protein YoqJ